MLPLRVDDGYRDLEGRTRSRRLAFLRPSLATAALLLVAFLSTLGLSFHLLRPSPVRAPPPRYDPLSRAAQILYSTNPPIEGAGEPCPFQDPIEALSLTEQWLLQARTNFSERAGLLLGKEGQVHPLFESLARGEEKIRGMVEKRSETLEEAAREYSKRYKRRPPKGFDDWWGYVVEHGVLLPDEFDTIETSLAPFRGFSREELQSRFKIASELHAAVVLRVQGGKAEAIYTPGRSDDNVWTRRRTDAQLSLIEPIAHLLPDFEMAFGLKDEPQILLSYEGRERLTTHSAEPENYPYSPPLASFPWAHSCPPRSSLRLGLPSHTSPLSFIFNHRSAQDPCLEPSLVDSTGFLIDVKGEWTDPRPRYSGADGLIPIMAMSKTERNADILGVPFDEADFQLSSTDNKNWSSKGDVMYWRGHTTGIYHSKTHGQRWRSSHRHRLVRALNPVPPAPPVPVLLAERDSGLAHILEVDALALKEWGYDVGLVGGPIQCDDGDGTCEEMRTEMEFVQGDPVARANDFKYLFDIDGNAWTSRYRRLMMTNSLVFKSTIFPEFYTDWLPEFFAFIPIKMDFSDVPSVLAFFRGSPTNSTMPDPSAPSRDEVARRIAQNGACAVRRLWRKEDMTAYVFRLYLEWARIQSDTGDYEEQR